MVFDPCFECSDSIEIVPKKSYGQDYLFFLFYLIHRMSNMSDSIHDSAYGEDYESSGSPAGGVTMHKIQKSSR